MNIVGKPTFVDSPWMEKKISLMLNSEACFCAGESA
jgi:hypothetical protein